MSKPKFKKTLENNGALVFALIFSPICAVFYALMFNSPIVLFSMFIVYAPIIIDYFREEHDIWED